MNRTVLKELVRRQKFSHFAPSLFQLQHDFINDPSKLKALLCGRRAGKSTVAASYLVKTCLDYPGTRSLYVGLTRSSAKKILWKELKDLNKKHQLRIKFNNTDLIAEFPNGSELYLIGANDEAAAEGIRGIKLKLAVIDEAASFRKHIQYLIDEILTPTLIDLQGTLCLIGTPGASCSGPFFSATQPGSEYSVHKWTILDNIYIPHAKVWLTDYKKKKGWQDDNPIYQREWLGRWVKSLDSLVYRFDSSRNVISSLPSGNYNYILSIDVGYVDATAFVVGAYKENDPTFYIVDTFAKSGMDVDAILDKAKEFIDRYNPVKTVIDPGAGGKSIAETYRKRYGVSILGAQKNEKADHIEIMNSDFNSGRIKSLASNSALHEQWEIIQWDEDRKREDERYVCDLADAALYAYRESTHYTQSVPLPEPEKFTPTYWQLEAQRMEEELEEALMRKNSTEWWEQ